MQKTSANAGSSNLTAAPIYCKNAGLVQLAMNERLHKQSPDEKMGMLEAREKFPSRPYRPVQITGVGRTDDAPISKVLGGLRKLEIILRKIYWLN